MATSAVTAAGLSPGCGSLSTCRKAPTLDLAPVRLGLSRLNATRSLASHGGALAPSSFLA